MDHKNISPWMSWISNQDNTNIEPTAYDLLCNLTIDTYGLDVKGRKQEVKDRVHYFLVWWHHNKSFMNDYNTLDKIGDRLNIGHDTVLHYNKDGVGKRKKSFNFEQNTKCIKDFLES